MIGYSAVAALVLALTHLLAGKLKFSFMPRNMWLSFAGGLSVAYVFIHLLPELADGQELLLEKGLEFFKHNIYLVALFGLTLFYEPEKAARQSSLSARDSKREEMSGKTNSFWLHLSFFTLYHAIIGYLLVHRIPGFWYLTFSFSCTAANSLSPHRSFLP